MRTIVIKNDTQEVQTWNKEFQPGEEYTIPTDSGLWNEYAHLDALLVAIANGDALIGDGGQFFTSVSEQISWLRNEVEHPVDDEGAELIKPKTTKPGWMQQFRCFNLKTAAWGSLVSKKPDNTNHTDCTLKFFDADDVEITAEENIGNAVRTQLEWEPPNDFDIAGGLVWVLETPTQDVFAWAVAVPDIPENYGGSKVNLDGGFNMKCLTVGTPFRMDGRTPKRMFYSATYHTTKMRFVFRHAAGYQLPIQIILDKYKA